MTATEATGLLSRRELSPVELLDAVVARTERTEPLIGAVTEQMLDDAYAAARESEQRFKDGTARPLEGIPLMLKEEQPIAGRLAEEGSLLERGNVSAVTHPIVDRIFNSGAVVHGRTTTPEFCCAPVTHTELWGITRNPFNTEMTPGGSSGGAGAVLAAGSTVLATGSDIGGSIRIPSSYCGVVGFKPPFGRVPGLAPFNSDTYCADGPMARSVADTALLQNVISGPWAGDQASLRPGLLLTADAQSLAGTKIALCISLGGYAPDPEVVANTLRFADALRAAGAIVEEVELPWTPDRVLEIAWIVTDDALADDVDADLVQACVEEQRVGVGPIGREQFGADRNDDRGRDRRHHATPGTNRIRRWSATPPYTPAMRSSAMMPTPPWSCSKRLAG